MKLHRYVDHQRLHIVTKEVISLSISVLLLFRHYISHKITFGAPSSGGVLCSVCGAFISKLVWPGNVTITRQTHGTMKDVLNTSTDTQMKARIQLNHFRTMESEFLGVICSCQSASWRDIG